MDARRFLPEQVGDFVRADTLTSYDRESIFDYIDGAGEVYNAYSFSDVHTARYVNSDSLAVLVELFDMGTPDDAYGVFSYARESEQAGIGGGFEARGGVLCFWQDRYYVCVSAEKPGENAPAVARSMAENLSSLLPTITDPPRLLTLLPVENRVAHSERFFHLHQVLNYNYYLARENILGLSEATDAVLARYAPGAVVLCVVEYPDQDSARRAHEALKSQYPDKATDFDLAETERSRYPWWVQEQRLLAIVFEVPDKKTAFDLLDRVTTEVGKYLSEEENR